MAPKTSSAFLNAILRKIHTHIDPKIAQKMQKISRSFSLIPSYSFHYQSFPKTTQKGKFVDSNNATVTLPVIEVLTFYIMNSYVCQDTETFEGSRNTFKIWKRTTYFVRQSNLVICIVYVCIYFLLGTLCIFDIYHILND